MPGAITKKASAGRSAGSKGRKPGSRSGGKKRKSGKKRITVPAWAAIALAAVLIGAFIVLPWLRDDSRKPGEGGDSIPSIQFSSIGIDISHNNKGPIIWDSLMVLVDRSGRTIRNLSKASRVIPVRFVFIKATEGAGMKDPEFKNNWKEAGRTEISRGAYHFFRSSKDGEIQAKNFISAVGDLRHSDLAPVLDIETMHRGCSRKTLNERALQWLKAVEKHYGRKPIVYTSESFARDILNSDITDNYPIWVAHYGVDSPEREEWEYWQFTDKALVYGMPEPVDMSIRRQK